MFKIFTKSFCAVVLSLVLACTTQLTFSQTCPNITVNGSFESPVIPGVSYQLINQNSVNGWTTTASDQLIEIWSTNFLGVPAYNGNQFAELNATQASTLIQTFPATAGDQLTLGFAHRGRDGVDVMSVQVGPVGGPFVTLGTYSDGNTAWKQYNASYNVTTTGNIQIRFTAVSSATGSAGAGNLLDDIRASLIPLPTITGTSSLCLNSTTAYSVSNVYAGYSWSVSGGTIQSGQGTSAVNINWNSAGSKSVTVTVTNASGCQVTSNSYPVTVNALSTPSFTAQAGASACINTDVTYTTQAGQNNYVWSVPGVLGTDYSITSGGVSSTDNTLTLKWLTGGSKAVTINYTNTNGCTAVSATSSTFTAISAVSVGGTSTPLSSAICSGSNTSVSLTGNTGSIQWQSSTNNSSFTDIAGETGANYVATNLSATTYYRAVVTNASCTPATSNTVSVTVKQPSTSTTNASICVGGSYSFGGSSYTTAGTYLVHLTNAVGCDSTATLNLTVNPLPPTPTITPSGATTFCAGGSVTLTTDAATSYAWTGGATTQAITVSTGGTYSVTVSNGTCTATSAPVTITVNPLNTITLSSIAATTSQTVYINTAITNIAYATANATGATFNGLPNGVTGNWSANVATISGTPTVSGAYNYTVTLTGGCGTITASGTITVVSVTITSSIPTNTICAGTSVTFTATPAFATNPTYQWKKNGVAISGATNSTYTTSSLTNNDIITVDMTVASATGGRGSIVSSGLIQNLDANKTTSYAGTGSTWYDISGNSNNGTLNSASFATTSGYSYFNLSNTYISAPVAKNASMTFNVWAKTSDPSNSMLFNAGNSGSGPDLFFWSNAIYWNIWDAGNTPFGVSTNIIDANWHQYTVVVDASTNNAKLYFDGVLRGTATYRAPSSNNLYIGGAGPGDAWYWKGAVASLQTYNRALSATEVTTNYNALNGATLPLTSNAITTIVNALPVVSATTQPGQFGNGLNFDGSTDYVSIPNSSSLNISSAITLEAWVHPTKLSGGVQNVMSKSSGSANNGYIFPRTDNSWSSFIVYLNIGGWKTLSFPYPTTGTWHHLAATYDGSIIKLYLNGTMVTSMAASGAISTNSNVLSLGNQPGFNEYYGGNVDELRIWNVARTQAQIQATMNTELLGNESALVAYYDVNQGVAGGNNSAIINVLDKTTNVNNGSFNTFTLNGATSNFVNGATSSGGIAAGNVCVSGTIQLSNTTTGGSWSSSNTVAATVSNTGLVTGITSGTTVISYTVTSASGCITTVTTNITVNDNPIVTAITGYTVLCSNTNSTLNNTTAGGVWSSASASIATVNASGVVSGVSGGTTNINYSITNASGCTTTVSTIVTVNAVPTVAAISGASAVCVGQTVIYTDATVGGVWLSSNANIATVDAAGVVSGVNAGATTINYTVTNSSGCITTVTKSITVNVLPVATISASGSTTLCFGSSVTLTASASSTYAWSNGATTRAITVSTAGAYNVVVTNASGCSTTSANTIVTVNLPSASTTVIKVPFGATYLFNGITYSATGIYTATLTNALGCDSIATLDFTIDPKPNAGPDQTVACGSTTKTVTLTGTLPTTGVWSSMAGNDPTATIGTNTNGVVEITLPVAPFTGKLSYVYTTFGGKDTVDIYVTGPTSPVINVNAGSPVICAGSTVQLCPQTWGFSNYQWYKDGYAVAGSTGTSSCITVDATGIGSYTLAGTNGAGCWSVPSAPQVVSTTNTLTKPTISVSGSTTLCDGGSVTLTSSSATGNLWFKNGNSTGAITTSITVTEPGDYSVLVSTGTCTSAMSVTTTVTGGVKASFTTSNATNNCDSTFSFTSTSANTTSRWNFGDGSAIGTGNSVTHKYATTGLFTVQQAVISTGGCKDTAVQTVTAVSCPPLPAPTTCNITPGFTVINNTINGGSYTYISTSTITNGNMTYFWDLGNGTTSTLISPSVTYATAGTYQVKLIVTGSLGCKDSITQSVVVTITLPPVTPPACTAPVADFTIANAIQCLVNNAFSFSNTSTGTSPSYTWFFGDGSAAVTTTAAAKSYTTANTYTVTLVATNSCGSNQISKTVTVATAPATPSGISGATTLALGTNTTLSSATTGGVWSSSNTAVATVNTSGVVIGVAAGTATISYTVSNSCGATATSLGITITAAVLPVTPPACTAPVANFTINNAAQCLTGNSFSFTNSSTGTTPSYTWTFGDGSASVTTTNSTYSYAAGNTYTVTLVATNACGSNQISKIVTVATAPATPSGISGATTLAPGTNTTLSSATTGGVWSSSNTAVATVNTNGIVTAITAGTVTISYTVTNSCGATATSLGITVTSVIPPVTPPVVTPCNLNAGFTINNVRQCVIDNQFVFTNTTTGGTAPYTYLWDLNDGTYASTQHVTKTYANYGEHDVTLKVTDANGCVSHANTQQLYVGAKPKASFSILTNTGSGSSTTFISSSTVALGTMNYLWDLGNGQTSTLVNPTTSYTPGTYAIKLIVSGWGTCKDTSIQSITELAIASVKVYPNPIMDVIQVSFVSASATPTTFKLMDLAGRTLQIQTVAPSSRGVNVLATMNTRGLQSGSYVLYISDQQNGFLATKTILKQ